MKRDPIFLITPNHEKKGEAVITAYEPGTGNIIATTSMGPTECISKIERLLTSVRSAYAVKDYPEHDPSKWVEGHGYVG